MGRIERKTRKIDHSKNILNYVQSRDVYQRLKINFKISNENKKSKVVTLAEKETVFTTNNCKLQSWNKFYFLN